MLFFVRPGERLLELAHTAPERASDLGQTLAPEEEKSHQQQEKNLRRADVAHTWTVALGP